MGQLTVIRHAQTSLMQADSDELSDLGHQQARLLGDYLATSDVHFDKVYLGTLKRHQQTADHIQAAFEAKGKSFPIQKMELLTKVMRWMLERALSEEVTPHLEHLRQMVSTVNEIPSKRQYIAMFDLVSHLWAKGEIDTSAIGIAPFEEFKNRIHQALQQVLKSEAIGQHIAFITSGGTAAVLVGKALSLDNGKIMELNSIIKNSAITDFLFQEDRFSLHRFNTTPHLIAADLMTYV